MANNANEAAQKQASHIQHEIEASLRAELIARGHAPDTDDAIRCKVRADGEKWVLSLLDGKGELRHNLPIVKNFKETTQNSNYGLPNSSEYYPNSIYFPESVAFKPTSLKNIVDLVNTWVRPEFAVATPSEAQEVPQPTIRTNGAELHPKIKAALEVRASRLPFDKTMLTDCKEKIETALKAEMLAKGTEPKKIHALKFDVYAVGPNRDTIQLSIDQGDIGRELVFNYLALDKGWEGTFRPAHGSRRVEPRHTHYFNAETFEDLLNSVNNWTSPENKIDTSTVLGKAIG